MVVAEGFSIVVPLFNEEERFAEYGKVLVEFIADQPAGSEVIFTANRVLAGLSLGSLKPKSAAAKV